MAMTAIAVRHIFYIPHALRVIYCFWDLLLAQSHYLGVSGWTAAEFGMHILQLDVFGMWRDVFALLVQLPKTSLINGRIFTVAVQYWCTLPLMKGGENNVHVPMYCTFSYLFLIRIYFPICSLFVNIKNNNNFIQLLTLTLFYHKQINNYNWDNTNKISQLYSISQKNMFRQ